MKGLKHLLKSESAGGVIMIVAAAAAMIAANSPLTGFYTDFLNLPVLTMPLHEFVKDVLMVFFFFQIGMELKREVAEGFLSTRDQILLPFVAAAGGMLVPAIIYMLINSGHPESISGWAIPAATDIAFALCVLSLAGKNIPPSVKIFLLAIAIFDDLGAILIIAFFYSDNLQLMPLLYSLIVIIGMYLLNSYYVTKVIAYIAGGVILWFLLHAAGIHTTIAGVITAFFIPLHSKERTFSPIIKTMHKLHPFVTFFILPMFAFVSAGIVFSHEVAEHLLNPISVGIVSGLFFGKQIGIFLTTFIVVKLGIASMPKKASWNDIYAVAIIAGIGFTMSLFISLLAFSNPLFQEEAKVGIIIGSILSALFGVIILKSSKRQAF